jgi:transposase
MKQEMSVLGIDSAKRLFHAVGMDERGKIVWRKRWSRHDLIPFIAKLPPVLIGIEACGGAHYWARRFRAYGHEVKLMAPQFVKPYVKSNKNDSRDAEAIAEAVTRPTMRFVPAKDVAQQDIQALHRVRERLIGERTALVNEVHGLLHEYGIVMPKGVAKFRQAVVGKLEADKDKLTPLSQEMFGKLVVELVAYLLAADNSIGPLLSHLSEVNQPVARSRIGFSAPRSRLLACWLTHRSRSVGRSSS